MQFFVYAVVLGFLQQVVARTALQQSLAQALQSQLSEGASVFLPSDANYSKEVTPRWTIYDEPTYQLAVKPKTETDVAKAITIAQEYNVPFLATGGGHGYTTSYAKTGLKQGLEIDLSNFQKISIDEDQSALTVGPGVRFSQLMDPLYKAGKEFTIAASSCPSVIGVSLGGGLGRYQGLHGLMVDNLLKARMVTAAGQLIEISASEHPDLFWAIRGAGFNYGVITEATYKVHDYVNDGQIMSADLKFAAKDNDTFFDTLKSYNNDKLPADLALLSSVVYDAVAKAPSIFLSAIYLGPTEHGKTLIKPFLDIGPEVQNISTIQSNELFKSALFGLDAALCEDGANRNSYAILVKGYDVPTMIETFNGLSDFYSAFPQAINSSMEIIRLPFQGVQAVPDDATAYPWRDAGGSVQFTFDYPPNDTTVDAAANNFARSARAHLQETSGFSRLQVHVSAAHGDESADALYSAAKLPRLLQLKGQWDPTNQFRFHNPLPFSANANGAS